jgi:hypothetical protein
MARSETITDRKSSAPRRISGKKTTGKGAGNTPASNPQLIAQCAYEIWQQQGRPHGQDVEHWLQAEQELATMKN